MHRAGRKTGRRGQNLRLRKEIFDISFGERSHRAKITASINRTFIIPERSKTCSAHKGRLRLVDLHTSSLILALDFVQRQIRFVPLQAGGSGSGLK